MNIEARKLRDLLNKIQEVEDHFRLMGLNWSLQIVKEVSPSGEKWASFVFIPDFCAQNKIRAIKAIRLVTGFDLRLAKSIVDEGASRPGIPIPLVGCDIRFAEAEKRINEHFGNLGLCEPVEKDILKYCFKFYL